MEGIKSVIEDVEDGKKFELAGKSTTEIAAMLEILKAQHPEYSEIWMDTTEDGRAIFRGSKIFRSSEPEVKFWIDPSDSTGRVKLRWWDDTTGTKVGVILVFPWEIIENQKSIPEGTPGPILHTELSDKDKELFKLYYGKRAKK